MTRAPFRLHRHAISTGPTFVQPYPPTPEDTPLGVGGVHEREAYSIPAVGHLEYTPPLPDNALWSEMGGGGGGRRQFLPEISALQIRRLIIIQCGCWEEWPVLDKHCAPMGPEILSVLGVRSGGRVLGISALQFCTGCISVCDTFSSALIPSILGCSINEDRILTPTPNPRIP